MKNSGIEISCVIKHTRTLDFFPYSGSKKKKNKQTCTEVIVGLWSKHIQEKICLAHILY